MRVLFIGRFQPFHFGHLSVLQEIDSRNDIEEIIIGIGSAQYSGTGENPYTFERRKVMIEKSVCGELKNKYRIVAIPDVHNNDLWVDYVASIVGKFDEVYTGNDLVKRLFSAKQYQVKSVKIYQGIMATKIRDLMRQDSEDWEKMVPTAVARLLG